MDLNKKCYLITIFIEEGAELFLNLKYGLNYYGIVKNEFDAKVEQKMLEDRLLHLIIEEQLLYEDDQIEKNTNIFVEIYKAIKNEVNNYKINIEETFLIDVEND